MKDGLKVGSQAELYWQVGAEHVIHLGAQTGPSVGSAGVVVFSTPNMVLLMERAARQVLGPFLEPGEESVGASVAVEHLAATPIGAQVRGVATVTHIERRQIDFDIQAFDAVELIGRGRHRRVIVQVDKLRDRLRQKQLPTTPGHILPMQTIVNTGVLARLETLVLAVQSSVATITLNRPEKLNAVNSLMTADWEKLNAWLAGHPEVRVVIIQGKGKAFCAGDDVPEVGTLSIEQAEALSHRQARMYLAWEHLPQVMVAAVQGPALGAGCVLACACDFRIAAHDAQFGMPEILLGWPPGYGIAQLTSLIGKSRAMAMCVTGEPISARTALDYGLVNRVVAQNHLSNACQEFAQSLLRLPSAALRETKRLIHLDEGMQLKNAFLADTAAYVRCLDSAAAREGILAFEQKRPPRFS